MACTSGCPSQDHASYADCLRDKNVGSMWLGGTGPSYGDQKKFGAENERFRSAVHQGLMPNAVSNRAVDAAYRAAEG